MMGGPGSIEAWHKAHRRARKHIERERRMRAIGVMLCAVSAVSVITLAYVFVGLI